MDLKDFRVFVCVPAVGKTTLTKLNNRFVDMDTLKAVYKYSLENITEIEMEHLKGNRGDEKRHDSDRYMKEMLDYYLTKTDKILLFSPNPKMVDMIYKAGVPYCLVYHSLECVEEYKKRMKDRGNQDNFIEAMLGEDVIYNFYNASVTDTRPSLKIELKPGEYLSKYLLQIVE